MSKQLVRFYPDEAQRIANAPSEFMARDVNVSGKMLKRFCESSYISKLGRSSHNITLWSISETQRAKLKRAINELNG